MSLLDEYKAKLRDRERIGNMLYPESPEVETEADYETDIKSYRDKIKEKILRDWDEIEAIYPSKGRDPIKPYNPPENLTPDEGGDIIDNEGLPEQKDTKPIEIDKLKILQQIAAKMRE